MFSSGSKKGNAQTAFSLPKMRPFPMPVSAMLLSLLRAKIALAPPPPTNPMYFPTSAVSRASEDTYMFDEGSGYEIAEASWEEM